MKARKALATKNHTRGFNLSFFAVVWLLLDRLQPADWVWGVVGAICAVLFLALVIDFFTAEEIEL